MLSSQTTIIANFYIQVLIFIRFFCVYCISSMGSMDQKPSTILDTKLLIVQRERIIYIPKAISWIQLVLFLLLFYCSVDQVCHTMIKKSRKIVIGMSLEWGLPVKKTLPPNEIFFCQLELNQPSGK